MNRRDFLQASGPYLGAALGLTLFGCNGESTAGPVEIKWDRDTCERCRMVISEKQYAVQIRDPNKKVHKFDDFGDAVFFLEHQQWPDAQIEFWVADWRDGRWLDARKAQFVSGKRTPMAYGFGAVAEAQPDSVSYAEAKKQILAKGK